MQVQLKTDRHIEAHDELAHQVETVMEGTVGRFADQITRVEVHLSDENSHKGDGDDKRCLLEARLAGLQPMAVSHQAATLLSQADINGGGGYLRTPPYPACRPKMPPRRQTLRGAGDSAMLPHGLIVDLQEGARDTRPWAGGGHQAPRV